MIKPIAALKRLFGIVFIAFIVLTSAGIAKYVWFSTARAPLGEQRVISTKGVTLSYNILSSSINRDTALFLIPSLGRPASDFNELAADLQRDGYLVYLIDPRDYYVDSNQPSDHITLFDLASDLEAIRMREGLQDIVVIGHAFGNRVARAYATAYPETTRSVITLAAGGRHIISDDLVQALTRAFWSFMPDNWREPYIRTAFFAEGNDIPDYWMRGWHVQASRNQIRATANTDVNKWWDAGSAPLLVIQGKQDPIAPPELTGDVLRLANPQRVSVITLSPASHALLPEQAEAITSAIRQFLAIHTQNISSQQAY